MRQAINNLYSYAEASQHHKDIISVIVALNATDEDKLRLRNIFKHIDKGNNAGLSYKDIRDNGNKIIDLKTKWKRIIKALKLQQDKDGGRIDFHEFIFACVDHNKYL